MKIILDTNAIVFAFKKKVDIFEAVREKYGLSAEIIIPNLVLEEINSLAIKASKGEDKRAAKLTLEILKTKKFSTLDLERQHTDSAIIEYSKGKDVLVVTNDYKFKAKLKEAGIKFTFLNNKKQLN